MRGKTTCPQCGEKYTLDVPDDVTGEHPTTCPKCGHSFHIEVGGQYSWEKDKTPLIPPSLHLKPRSLKPKIAAVLLGITCVMGLLMWGTLYMDHEELLITTAADSPWKAPLFRGYIVNETGNGLANVSISLQNHTATALSDSNGKFSFQDAPWGYQTLILEKDRYNITSVTIFIFPLHFDGLDQDYVLKKGTGETQYESQVVTDINTLLPLISLVMIGFCIVALLGGICAFLRKYFPLALLGAILGLFTIGPLLLGFVLSIAAAVLIVLARDEFGEKPNEIIY